MRVVERGMERGMERGTRAHGSVAYRCRVLQVCRYCTVYSMYNIPELYTNLVSGTVLLLLFFFLLLLYCPAV